MKIKYLLMLVLHSLVSNTVNATSYSSAGAIDKMTTGKDFARVRLDAMESYEECEKQDWYILEFGSSARLPMYSMLLAAKASKQKVSFQLQGCKHGYAVITHVYNN
ncbi:hypothetical protein [Alteromonas lipotrueae]|uniref:hypothetical protein n=1 Tax=Alteromonas lipotrueae TaxID=2803814 RepID=UPI001C47CCAA|nr:hypothetical protein [Alteromonas lipotrueae]